MEVLDLYLIYLCIGNWHVKESPPTGPMHKRLLWIWALKLGILVEMDKDWGRWVTVVLDFKGPSDTSDNLFGICLQNIRIRSDRKITLKERRTSNNLGRYRLLRTKRHPLQMNWGRLVKHEIWIAFQLLSVERVSTETCRYISYFPCHQWHIKLNALILP